MSLLRKRIKQFLLWYGIAILLLAIIIVVIIVLNDFGNNKPKVFYQMMASLFTSMPTYLVLTVPYLFFLFIKSFVKDYTTSRFSGLAKGFAYKAVLPALLIWLCLKGISMHRLGESYNYVWDHSIENDTSKIKNLYAQDKKQRGFHVFDILRDTTSLELLKKHNVEWVTLVPFLSQTDHNTSSINTNLISNDAIINYKDWRAIKQRTDAYGFKIMIKPHIWLANRDNGIWRSDIKMESQEEWDDWFKTYSDYILAYARLSEELHIELFCIGTELKASVIEQPEKWRQLINEVRKVYSGKLTYGANWDREVHHIQFWDALDFIGIQAYYPISANIDPELKDLESGWNSHLDILETLSNTYNKPIIFTELGYKSTTDAAIKPWEWNTLSNRFYKKISKRTQALCYQAFFNTIWKKEWFEGAHIWEWRARANNSKGDDNAFTVQGKPALNIIAKSFERAVN